MLFRSGFSANTGSNYTYDLKVGPALTALATLMTTAGAGFIKRGATADTYTIDTNTYLTSYTETDTLATVTGRGATTSIAVSLNGGITINDGGTAGNTTVFGSYKRLIFDNSYNDVARGPNKIVLYNDASAWIGGFGIHTSTLGYYSGDHHVWYKSTSQTAFTERMRITTNGGLAFNGSSNFGSAGQVLQIGRAHV